MTRILTAFCLAALVHSAAAKGAPEVRSAGSLREIIHQGRIEPRAALRTALLRPHAWALGALGRLDGDFVVLDGAVHESRPAAEGAIRATAYDSARDSATLLVYANVPAWRGSAIGSAPSLAALEDTIANQAERAGFPRSGPIPFRLEGPISGLRWHVVDGRKLPPGASTHEAHAQASVKGGGEGAGVSIVGFYSDHHQGVFTHHDSGLHMHAWIAGTGVAAHVDSLGVEPGTRLLLPSR
jgi:acetolactate decarboxylase